MASKKSQRKRANPTKPKSVFESKGVKIGILVLIIAVIFIVAAYLYSGMIKDDDTVNINGNEVIGNPIAIIETSMGTIKVELYQDKVPNTCDNFIKLANDGFYENLIFHRVIDDFMIQGGGFFSDGTQKESPYGSIDLEIHQDVRHVDGAIAMARTNDPNSATSQFYICDGVQSFLDDNYAAFGKVVEGMNIVRNIASVDTGSKYGAQDWPEDDVTIVSITIENE